MHVLEDQIEFGCSMGDLICTSFEAQARGMGDFLGWLAELVLGSQDLAPGTALWDSAIGEASNWFAISIIVMLATGIIGLSTGMLSLKGRNVWLSIGGIAAAIPSTYLALGLGGELLSISDQISDLTLERIGGGDGFADMFRAVAQGGTGSDLGGVATTVITGGTASALPTLLMLVMIIIGLIMMSFALAFRNLALMILIAFAPLAFMAVPMKGGWSIAKKWGLAGIALLLSKPLMFGVLAMLLESTEGLALFSAGTLTVATGLFVVSFMPMMAYSFFSFLGSGNESMAGGNIAGQASMKATNAGRTTTNLASRGAGGVTSMFKRGGSGGAGKPGAAGPGAKSTGTKSTGGATGKPGAGGKSAGGDSGKGPNGGGSPSQVRGNGGGGAKPSSGGPQVPSAPQPKSGGTPPSAGKSPSRPKW